MIVRIEMVHCSTVPVALVAPLIRILIAIGLAGRFRRQRNRLRRHFQRAKLIGYRVATRLRARPVAVSVTLSSSTRPSMLT